MSRRTLGEAPDELQHQVSADPHEVLKLVDDDMAQLRDEGPVLSDGQDDALDPLGVGLS